MNVKLRVLSAGALFFLGQAAYAQKKPKDTTSKETKIEEVVVLGYNKTATKPKDVSSSVTVSAEKFENRPNTSFLNSLQGEAPGLSINSTSGSPGSAKIDVIIRGVGSINSNSDPLYVIDGMISNSVQFRNLNPNDLESVSVLKDAAATSIYGNRGANGVIVIRTKQGKFGSRMTLSYSGTIGVSILPDTDYNMANAQQLLTLQKRTNNGAGASMTDQQIAAYSTNTDWRKQLFRTGMTQGHDLSMMFGGELVNNYTSFGYLEQGGVVPQTDFKRFTLRNNLNGKSKNGRFTYNSNIALGYSKRHQLDEETNTNISSNVVQNPLIAAITGNPTLPANIYSSGLDAYNGMNGNTSGGKNIYVLEDVLRGSLPNLFNETSIVTNFSASYKLTDDLSVTNKSGIDYRYAERFFARSPLSYLAIAVAKQSATATVPNPYGGSETIQKTREFNFNSVTSLAYHKVLNDKHTFDVGAYLDYLKVDYGSTSQTQNGLNPLNWVFGAGTGYVPFDVNNPTFYRPTIQAGKIFAGTLAYFATLDYDYDSKYGLSGVIRRDGTYRFVNKYQWGTFWSVAGRWNIDKEAFMEGSTFDMLKLRASYGIQGNQNVIAATAGTNPLIVGTNIVRDLNTVGLGYNNINGSYYTGALANPNAQWEEIGQFDVGVDFRLWNRKIEGSFDFYNKKTDKLYNDLYISNITGTTQISGNNGSLQNRGIEGMLRYNIINNSNVKLSIYANAAYNKSKLLSLIKDDEVGSIRNVVGGQLAEWYAVPYVGVNQSNGNLLYLDINGNVTENPNPDKDARATGKNYLPKWSGGFGLNSEYKGFYLDAHFSFQQGAWRYDNQLDWVSDVSSANSFNVSADLLNAWTPTNTNTNIPSLTANLGLAGSSDKYLKDASFIRLKTFAIGYNVPKSFLNEKIKGLKIFVQGENLLTWTKWKGYDPEPNFATSVSVYPNLKTVSLGVSADF